MATDSLSDIEEWRPVVGFEGWYEVSSLGRVRRIRQSPGQRTVPYILVPAPSLGYLELKLSRDGVRRKAWVHRLVAAAFLGRPPTPRHEVAHWDGVRSNCAASNLRWATNEENRIDRLRHGTYGWRLSEAQVRAIIEAKPSGQERLRWASELGVSPSTIHYILAGKLWKHLRADDAGAA